LSIITGLGGPHNREEGRRKKEGEGERMREEGRRKEKEKG
jgi:hypothetical protein